jgi:hypothetical protein
MVAPRDSASQPASPAQGTLLASERCEYQGFGARSALKAIGFNRLTIGAVGQTPAKESLE